jgi:hypothetical protein
MEPIPALKNQVCLILTGMDVGRRRGASHVLRFEQRENATGLRTIGTNGDPIARRAPHVCPGIWEGDKGLGL